MNLCNLCSYCLCVYFQECLKVPGVLPYVGYIGIYVSPKRYDFSLFAPEKP